MAVLVTWRDAIDANVEHLRARGWDETTLVRQRRNLTRFFGCFLWTDDDGSRAVADVTPDDVERYRLHLATAPSATGQVLAVSSQKQYLLALRNFFGWIEGVGLVFLDPTDGLELPSISRHRMGKILTESEMTRLLDAPDTSRLVGVRDRAILEVLYSTGMRLDELSRLTIHDVDLSSRTIRINDGKGGKDRLVPIGGQAAHHLTEYLTRVRGKHLGKRVEPALFIATGKTPGVPMTKGAIRAMLHRYSSSACGGPVSPHTIRRSTATHMLASGASIEVVRQLLGHADYTALRFYARLFDPDLRAEHRRAHPRERDARGGRDA